MSRGSRKGECRAAAAKFRARLTGSINLQWYERNILKKETFDRIRALVDKNDDGSVDKKEFLDGFWKAFVKVVDSNKLNSELGRVRAAASLPSALDARSR